MHKLYFPLFKNSSEMEFGGGGENAESCKYK